MTTPLPDFDLAFSLDFRSNGVGSYLLHGVTPVATYRRLKPGYTYTAMIANRTRVEIIAHRSEMQANASRIPLGRIAPGTTGVIQEFPVAAGEVCYFSLTSPQSTPGEIASVKMFPTKIVNLG